MEDCEADLRPPLGSECEGWGGGGQSAEEKIASTHGKPELSPNGYARSSCPTITVMGYERTAYLALAATAVPSGSEPIEAQTCAN